MGLFLQVVLFPNGEELKCHTAVRCASEDPELNIHLDCCRWRLYEKGPAVLMNDDCCGYEELAQTLSTRLSCPVMVLFTYDGDYWGYFLWERGTEIDRFHSYPEYFSPGDPPNKPGNVQAVERLFFPEREIVRYLLPWDEEAMGSRAYSGDTAVIGDCWQMADFMAALGFDYDLLCPPESPPDPRQAVPIPASELNQEPYPHNEHLAPKEIILLNALTDPAYALLRAEEVEDVAPEAVTLFRKIEFNQQHREVAELLTAAIQAHPDRTALYILRSFCWNQVEGYPTGRSRKPDMDRDMTKVLELEPDNVMALRAHCPATGTSSRYRRHIQDLTRLMELDPEHWDVYLTSRAYHFHWLGDDVSARADLTELVQGRAALTVDLSYLLGEFGMI